MTGPLRPRAFVELFEGFVLREHLVHHSRALCASRLGLVLFFNELWFVMNECFDEDCARSKNPSATCNCADYISFYRQPNGTYGTDLMGQLPPSAATLAPSLGGTDLISW